MALRPTKTISTWTVIAVSLCLFQDYVSCVLFCVVMFTPRKNCGNWCVKSYILFVCNLEFCSITSNCYVKLTLFRKLGGGGGERKRRFLCIVRKLTTADKSHQRHISSVSGRAKGFIVQSFRAPILLWWWYEMTASYGVIWT